MDFLQMFRQYFGEVPDAEQHKTKCPWHDDKDPSLVLYIKTGEYFCFGCSKKGNIAELVENLESVIDEAEVIRLHGKLIEEVGMMSFLEKARGWDLDTIKKMKLGWNGNRIAIPIRNENGDCVNLRLYDPASNSKGRKVMAYGKGFGKSRWFPCPPTGDKVYLFEGEPDSILARKMGINAYSQTGGAGYWSDLLAQSLFGKDVVVVYDSDPAGRAGAYKVCQSLKVCCQSVKDVRLPVSGKSKDFTDWIINDSATHMQFSLLCETTPSFIKPEMTIDMSSAIHLPLERAMSSEYAYKPFFSEVVVAGKDRAPYLLPCKVAVECSRDAAPKICATCPNSSGTIEYDIKWEDGSLLNFIDCMEEYKVLKIKKILNIPKGCNGSKVVVRDHVNVERLAVYPHIEWSQESDNSRQTLMRAYFVGRGISTNTTYVMKGITVPDVKDQSAVFLAVEMDPFAKDTTDQINFTILERYRICSNDTSRTEPDLLMKTLTESG